MRDLSRALGYCRVSTQRQHTEGHGLERYIERLKQHGLTDEQIYWDIESGASEKRAGYNKVLSEVRSHKVDKIIVPCFDRFTRSPLGWEQAKNELLEFNVELIFLDGGSLDLETPEGLFTSRILAAMSAQVRDKNRHNSIQGHRFYQEKRKIYQAIFGFVKDGDSIKPNLNLYKNTNKTYCDIASEMIDRFLANGNLTQTVRQMCDNYGVERISHLNHLDFPHSSTSFRRWMENPLICGMVRYYGEDKEKMLVLASSHEGIISVDKFNQIAAILSLNPCGRRDYRTNPLVSLCYCGVCGSKMKKITSKVKYASGETHENNYLRCTGAHPRAGKKKVCDYRRYFQRDEAIAICITKIKEKASAIANNLIGTDQEEETIEVRELKQQIFTLKQLNDPDLKNAIAFKEQRLENLCNQKEVSAFADASRYGLYEDILKNDSLWDKFCDRELTVIFQELVERVICLEVSGVQAFSVILKD